MQSNPDHDEQPSTDQRADNPQTDQRTEQANRSPDGPLSRRHVLVGMGIGVGLLQRRTRIPPEPRERPWNQDVDADGHELHTLGGLNMEQMPEDEIVTSFDGSNLEIDGTSLSVRRQLDIETVTLDEIGGSLTGGESVNELAGDNLVVDSGRLDVTSAWSRTDALLEPSDSDVDGIEVDAVRSSDEANLEVESDSDLVLSISEGAGAVRIETPGGHEIVLDDADESESVAVEDSAGNSIELDTTSDTVSISANQKIELDAPTIELSAGADLDLDSGGNANIGASGVMDLAAGLIELGGSAGQPAASVGDRVEDGLIQSGNPTVLL